jgi:SAM-dependent methyltransferase
MVAMERGLLGRGVMAAIARPRRYLLRMDFYTDFAAHYERVFPFRPRTLAFLRDHLPDQGRVLDLGCGPGHYTGALAADGLEAVGIDIDEAMIAAARERYPAALFVAEDLAAAPSLVAAADGAFCIGNVLPHLAPDGLGEFLIDLAGVLPPGAPWLLQTVNYDRLLPLRAAHDFPGIDAGDGLVFQRRYEPLDGGAVRFVTRLARGDEAVFSGETRLWPLTARELTTLHAEAGLRLREQCGGFAGEPYDPASSGGLVQVYERR